MAKAKNRNSVAKHPICSGVKYPSLSDDYAWLDYYELRCLLSRDKILTKGDIVEDLESIKGVSPHLRLMASNDSVLDLYEDEDEDEDEDDYLEDESDVVGRKEANARGLIYGISFRKKFFGDWYPFSIRGEEKDEVCLGELTDKHKLYIQLLLSSNLRLIPENRWNEITEPFEAISHKVFTLLMPLGWEVHRFGAKGAVKYKGSLYNKLSCLAKDIKADFRAKQHYFKKGNNGDGGLDLVAWHPLCDQRSGIPAAFAQCGCTLDGWPSKSLEASNARLKNIISPLVPWTTYYFMPHDLLLEVDGKQDWQRGNDITECIFVDRLRILNLIGFYEIDASSLYSNELVNELLELVF